MPDVTEQRIAAARGLLADYERGCEEQVPDWRNWANRLSGALGSITTLADAEHTSRRELADALLVSRDLLAATLTPPNVARFIAYAQSAQDAA